MVSVLEVLVAQELKESRYQSPLTSPFQRVPIWMQDQCNTWFYELLLEIDEFGQYALNLTSYFS